MVLIGKEHKFGLLQFRDLIFKNQFVEISRSTFPNLQETREFIDFLLKNSIDVYGITTGLADLRHQKIDSIRAAQCSLNLIESHDAGIGDPLPYHVTLGAMVIRAVSLAKGYSGFQPKSLETLVKMINERIVPQVPKTGSLGASGDLAFLARVGRAMCGDDVPVWYKGKTMSATDALKQAGIEPFAPSAKEGLAVTNGTSFICSMLSIAYLKQLTILENILALQGLFLNAARVSNQAFTKSIQQVRDQKGQNFVAHILSKHFQNSCFPCTSKIQDDYCIRCLPQIFGPKIELILEQHPKIETELNSVTDNPLIFRESEISKDVDPSRIWTFQGQKWSVLSGGNFHGECLTTIVDNLCAANAKIALTLERQITYILNPFRNKHEFPIYLITDKSELGVASGFMITQYTANALAQRIAQLGIPTSIFNITSGNESEDIVSYGSTAAERFLEQLTYLNELSAIYLTVAVQAYAISRKKIIDSNGEISKQLLAEKIFMEIQKWTREDYSHFTERSFDMRYDHALKILESDTLRSTMGYPLFSQIEN